MATSSSGESRKTIKVSASTHGRLQQLKPYETMSFDELLEEMAAVYAKERRAP